WKTTNLLATNPTWTPLWDDKDFVTQGVSAVAIDPNNSNVVYAGTGDWAAADQFSAGIMKSTDAGATWTQLGADVFTPFSPTVPAGGNRWSNQNIKTVAVDPNDSQTVLVGTRYDLYLSNDGGATWDICGFGANYTNPGGSGTPGPINRISDIYLDSRGAQTTAYVAVGFVADGNNGNNGVYRFDIPSSGCPSWPGGFTTLFGGFPSGTGNGTNGGSRTGRIELAGSTSSGSLTLYAQVADATSRDNEGTYVLRPDGGSTTWTRLSGWNSYGGCSAAGTNQDWYDLFIAVDPNDDKRLFIGHIDVFAATVNSGYTSMSQTNLTHVYNTSGCAFYGRVHPDQHAVAWIGNTGEFLVGNDGGVYRNTNGTGNGWRQLNNSFNTNQFYAGQIGANFAAGGRGAGQWLFGGMQDNGNASWDSSQSDFEWTARSLGGDGFFTTFDPLAGTETAGRWMTEYTYGSLAISTSGANGPFSGCNINYVGSPDWSTPFMLDTLHCTNSTCSKYLLGEDYVWAATGYSGSCPSWSRISGSMVKTGDGSIITVASAPSEPKAVAVGTDDGKVWWSQTAYSGGNCTQGAANSSSFSCSANTGASWIDADASNGTLPNRAVLQVAFDPDDHNTVYAAVGGFDENTPGTPGHLFQLVRSGSSITVVNKTGNLPNVPASAVAVNPHDRKQVFVGTHFGFFYTADIDAATPTWIRYNDGLPNTVIAQLTIDRGPDSDPLKGTTLAAFTYGRGIYLLKLPQPAANDAPVVTISAPADGTVANIGDSVSFAGGATDTEDGNLTGSLSWSSSLDGAIGTGGSFSTSVLSQGAHTITASVTDSGGTSGSDSITVTVVDPNSNGPQTAVYNAGLGVPACGVAGSSCDSGTLLQGRGTVGPEANQPNTLDTCSDGGSGTYQSDESNEAIVVSTAGGGDFVEGAAVQVDVTVWSWNDGSADSLDLYYAADANSPSWTFIATLQPSAGGSQTLSTTYTLPSGTLQAVRANFRYQGSAAPCTTGNYDDADDLVFAVKPSGANTAPSASISAPTNGSSFDQGTSVTFTGAATDAEDGALTGSLSWSSSLDGVIGTGGSFSTSALSVGSHTVTASVADSGGLTASASVNVTIDPVVGGGVCNGTTCIDWDTTGTVSYSNQDNASNVQVLDSGDTIRLLDNTWRRTTQTFTVTANTVVEFDFTSTSEGEIHGIGFDADDTLSSDRIFKVHGTQTWGIAAFDDYAGGTKTYSIPVGQYFTGASMFLVLTNDNDAGTGNDSSFRNVRVYESTPTGGTCAADVTFESGAEGWTNDPSSTCSTGAFVVGSPTQQTNGGVTTQLAGAHGGSGAFFSATNSSAGNADVDGGTCVVLSPVYSVSEASNVSAWYFHGQRDAGTDAGDFFSLEMSTDGGSTWSTLASYGDVTVNAAWTEATGTVAAGSSVRFRVQVADGPAAGDLVEAGIDDVSICPQ
ncbi:MAG: hypothetical protein AAGD06_03680, partial [Acidobacteriota bacterium]